MDILVVEDDLEMARLLMRGISECVYRNMPKSKQYVATASPSRVGRFHLSLRD
jgi:hypothetical protein